MPQSVEIVFATDNYFAPPLAVALLSLFQSNASNKLRVTIILIDVNPDNRQKLEALCSQFVTVETAFRPFDVLSCGDFPISRDITAAAYARIFAQQFLPPECNRVLYLDCDLLILEDLTPLWETDMQGMAIAGVANPALDRHVQLGMPHSAPYINSGVLLINLAYWRENQVVRKLTDFITRYSDALYFHDQDALNGCLYENIRLLPTKWNVSHTFYMAPPSLITNLSWRQLKEVRRHPAIVHFTGPTKPWKYETIHPFKERFNALLKQTPFCNPIRQPVRLSAFCLRKAKILGRPVKQALFDLGIRCKLVKNADKIIFH